MLAPASEATKPSPWLDLGVQSLRLYPQFLEELRDETGRDVEHRACGCLYLDPGASADRLETLHRSTGMRVERRGNSLFYPEEGIVDPGALLRSLRHAAEKRGVIIEHAMVSEVRAAQHKAVVIAAGAWSGTIPVIGKEGPLHLPKSEPVKGHLIGFHMRPGLLESFLRKDRTYVLQRADGLVIAGTTEEHVGFDTSVQMSSCEDLHRRAAEVVPELAAAEPVRRWIGFRPGPEHEDGPILRRLDDSNVWLAYGHYRNGILLTPVTAHLLAPQIAAA
jgi:glycine oxidase